MCTAKNDIETFLKTDFTELQGYFDRDNEKAEKDIVEKTISSLTLNPPPISFEIKEDSRGCDKRYSLEIIVNKSTVPITSNFSNEFDDLQGQLLRNRSRIESNLLTAIRKLISEKMKHWNASVIGKVTVTVQ